MMKILNHKIYGNGSERVFIVHGIFGMLDNWQYHAKFLSNKYTVITLDVRNHGKSFHDSSMHFEEMAEDIKTLALYLNFPVFHLVGHSMGGKICMKYASMFPETLQSLTIIDIAPKAYPPSHVVYFKAFSELPLESFLNRIDLEAAFKEYAPNDTTRLFLLKNMEAIDGGGYKTKSNMPVISQFYTEIIGDVLLNENAFLGKTTFIYGDKSDYVLPTDYKEILVYFPKTNFVSITDAGHWVHADKPIEFGNALLQAVTLN